MKRPSKVTILCILAFVVMPLTYLLLTWSGDKTTNSGALRCSLVEQHTDGNTLIATLKNEGTAVWSEEKQIRCTIFMNGQDTGIRVMLQPSQTVAPGETAEFHFYDVLSTFDETAEIVMLQETVAYFEERFPVE